MLWNIVSSIKAMTFFEFILILSLRSNSDLYHALTWPQVSFVAEDHKGRIVGYILAKM